MCTNHCAKVGEFASVRIGKAGCCFDMNDYLYFAIGVEF